MSGSVTTFLEENLINPIKGILVNPIKKILINLVGVYLLFCLVALVAIPIHTYSPGIIKIPSFLGKLLPDIDVKTFSPLIKTLIYVSCAGGLGGTIYCIKGYYWYKRAKNFSLAWAWWYIFRPFISAVIGAVFYLLIIGGLLSISSSTDVNYSKSRIFYCAVTFLAGFSFGKATAKLADLSSTLFASKEDKTTKPDTGV